MSWYDTDDQDYMHYRLVWGDLYPGQRDDPARDPVPEGWREWGRTAGGELKGRKNTREIRRLRRRVREKAVEAETAYQRIFDDLCTAAEGMPPEEIVSALAFAFSEVGQFPTDAELADYAERVSKGGRIVLEIDWPEEWPGRRG